MQMQMLFFFILIGGCEATLTKPKSHAGHNNGKAAHHTDDALTPERARELEEKLDVMMARMHELKDALEKEQHQKHGKYFQSFKSGYGAVSKELNEVNADLETISAAAASEAPPQARASPEAEPTKQVASSTETLDETTQSAHHGNHHTDDALTPERSKKLEEKLDVMMARMHEIKDALEKEQHQQHGKYFPTFKSGHGAVSKELNDAATASQTPHARASPQAEPTKQVASSTETLDESVQSAHRNNHHNDDALTPERAQELKQKLDVMMARMHEIEDGLEKQQHQTNGYGAVSKELNEVNADLEKISAATASKTPQARASSEAEPTKEVASSTETLDETTQSAAIEDASSPKESKELGVDNDQMHATDATSADHELKNAEVANASKAMTSHRASRKKTEAVQPKRAFRRFGGPKFPAPGTEKAIAKEKKEQLDKELKAYKQKQKSIKMHRVGHALAKHARHPQFHEYEMEPIETSPKKGRCGSKIAASQIGLKRNTLTAKLWRTEALLQLTHHVEQAIKTVQDRITEDEIELKALGTLVQLTDEPQVSYAHPGAGAVQEVADHGRSLPGKVNNNDEGMVEAYVRVFKDGFYPTNCLEDVMYLRGDKYSYGKHRYQNDLLNTSIVMYREMVVDSEWKAMTPKVCFEFCRTIPDMVFFGLTEGRECYCTPYYELPMTQSRDKKCDIPCEGDSTVMCGGKMKSSLFEMHLCADFEGAIKESATIAEEMMSYMYDTAFIAAEMTTALFASGKALKEIAGQSGLPDIADLGLSAEQTGMELIQATVSDGCFQAYKDLVATYKDAKELLKLDFTLSKNLQKSDDAQATMRELSVNLDVCTKRLEQVIELSYPFFHDYTEIESTKDLKEEQDEYSAAFETYYPLLYVVDKVTGPKMSSCEGEMIGKPTVLSMPECAQACDELVYPTKCIGFQYYQLGKSDEFSPICFLFGKFKSVTSFECPFLDDLDLIQTSSKTRLRGTWNQNDHDAKQDPPVCEAVRQSTAYSGLSCKEFYAGDSPYVETCPKTCKRTEGALMSSTCMVKLSESTGVDRDLEISGVGRCFGVEENKAVDQSGSEPHTITDMSDSGPVMEGDFEVGTYGTMEDPMNFMWTRK